MIYKLQDIRYDIYYNIYYCIEYQVMLHYHKNNQKSIYYQEFQSKLLSLNVVDHRTVRIC